MTGDDEQDVAARRAFLAGTAPSGAGRERVHRAVAARIAEDDAARRAFVAATRADPERMRRLAHRVAGASAEARRGVGWGWAAGLAAAAAAAVLIGAVATGGAPLGVRPAPEEALSGAIAEVDGEPLRIPLDDVALSFHGEGRIRGTERAPVIDWSAGTLSVAVTPDRGVDLTVQTDEARVEVVGTVFVVDRAAGATHVAVRRGTVKVTCVGEGEVLVRGGETRTCLAPGAASRVARVVALTAADPAEQLGAIDDALAVAGGDAALRSELLAHRVGALVRAGRTDEAVAVAEQVLASAHTARRAELTGFVGRTRFAQRGCDAPEARDALERAVAVDPRAPEGLLLAACLVDADPGRARALLAAAGGSASSGELVRLAERLRQALGEGAP